MIGFEIEIALPVVDRNRQSFDGEVLLGTSPKMPINLVTDHRANYSNLEFVTGAFSVTGRYVNSGPANLTTTLTGIRAIRDAFYLAGETTVTKAAGPLLTLTDEGKTARLDPNSGYEEDALEPNGGDGLYVQYTIGVPLNKLEEFYTFLRNTVAQFDADDENPLDHARWRTSQAEDLASDADKSFRKAYPKASDATRTQLRGYIQLVYTQVAAVADYLWDNRDEAEGDDADQIKNGTVALCRAAFCQIFPLLNPTVQAFLSTGFTGKKPLLDLIAKYQGESEFESGEEMDFRERDTRAIGNTNWSLSQYAQSALTGKPQIAQQSMFGGMRMIGPHDDEGATMIAFELRTMGSSELKTWAEVQSDLDTLVEWVQSVV